PTDHARPPVQRFLAAHRWREIDAALLARLDGLAAARGATLFTLLVACFEVLLARYTGQDEFLIGIPTMGRTRPSWTEVVGYFANLIPLRARLHSGPSIADTLEQVRTDLVNGMRHQDLPFGRLGG